ncbi:CheR family methyltransferase [Actinoplanes sp. NPDC051851]|uniref:CheR family methyltransferase n=1 Tax=Actinoplanes sp. NPDC051851 TaxID=3154753 RepID=UPI00343AF2E9
MTDPDTLQRFRDVLRRRLGWTTADPAAIPIEQVLADRAGESGLTASRYVDRLAGREWQSETAVLAEKLSITETYFFRHSDQFRALAEKVLPERVAARGAQKVLRLLSVGCSSGEEAYSLAITALRARPDPSWIVQVVGADANPEMLRRAERGCYSEWVLRETPATAQERWFRRTGEGFQISADVASAVRFMEHNLAGPPDPRVWQPGRYDVVFCRNVLMYLTREVVAEVVRRMTGALVSGGALFLGHTDSLGARPEGLLVRHCGDSIYYLRAEPPAPVVRTPSVPTAPARPMPGSEDVHRRALDLLRGERFADAVTMIEAIPAPDPRLRLLHGVLLAQVGRLAEARETARHLIDNGGPSADAHQLLGLCHEVDDPDHAVGQYRLAAYLDPSFAMPRLRMGLLARRRGDGRGAAAELEAALDLLGREGEERIALFGGGFGRLTLVKLCRTELESAMARGGRR